MTLHRTYANSNPILRAFEPNVVNTIKKVLKGIDNQVLVTNKILAVLAYTSKLEDVVLRCTVELGDYNKHIICELRPDGYIRHISKSGWYHYWAISGVNLSDCNKTLRNIIDVSAYITKPDGDDHYII